MDAASIATLLAAVSALLVALCAQCHKSRCTEIDIGDWLHLKRDLKSDDDV